MIMSAVIVSVTIAGALLAVVQGNIVRAIFGLALALVGVGLAFLELGSPFVAAMQVLIYIGGISVAMVFAVMLSSAGRREPRAPFGRRALAVAAAVAFFCAVGWAITSAEFPMRGDPAPVAAWSVQEIGRNLIDRFNVVFELLSIVLLLAIIGAIRIAKAPDRTPAPEGGAP